MRILSSKTKRKKSARKPQRSRNQTPRQQKRRGSFRPGIVVASVLMALGFVCLFAALWFLRVFGDIGFDAILYTLSSSMGGVQSDLLISYLLGGLVPAVVAIIAAALLLFILPRSRNRFRRGLSMGLALVLALGCTGFSAVAVGLDDYIHDMLVPTPLFEDEYVDPNTVSISFPEKKRNLVYIYLESMEASYLSKELGGAMEDNLIPELYELALEGTNFSSTDGVGGFHETSGAAWTVGSMVAQTGGVPLKTPSGNQNDYGKNGEEFLPGLTTLNNILHDEGYYQTMMVGSDANFGGRKPYFLQHQVDHVYDIYTARKDGIVPKDYFVWWGMEDLHLFDYARQELTKISRQEQPFAFAMLTVDTHHIGGYTCDLCDDKYEESYSNAIACSSRQVLDFVRWLQDQPFYDNTTIVITGDHNSMDRGYFDRNVPKNYPRRVYHCILNAPVQTEHTKNREYCAIDLFPTTLAAIGCEIEGNRLGLGTNLYSNRPTLAEEMGFAEFNSALAQTSQYYTDHFYSDADREMIATRPAD